MRLWLVSLLFLGLAGCDESQSPDPAAVVPEPEVPQVQPLPEVSADPAGDYHVLRQGWLEIERPAPVLDAAPPSQTPPEPAAKPQPPLTLPMPQPSQLPAIGIIIDDVGHSLRQGQRVIALPAPVALAILPHTQAAARLAAEASSAGKVIMLHQPMESGGGLSIGPGGLYVDMPRQAIVHILQDNLNSLPSLKGLNNHMGSRLTAQRETMDWTMAVLRERGLFFIDSRTTADTQAAFAAEAAGVKHLSRDVFLDNQRTAAAIDVQFQRALQLARKQGVALIIGHPYPQTLDYLEQRLLELETKEGVQVLGIEDLLARKYQVH